MKVVVVGAGIVGLSIAYALYKLGAKDLIVLTDFEVGNCASGVSGGTFRFWHDHDVFVKWACGAHKSIKKWEDEWSVPFHSVGLHWVDYADNIKAMSETLSRHDVEHSVRSTGGLATLTENYSGFFEPMNTLIGLVGQLSEANIPILQHRHVEELTMLQGSINAVRTRNGEIIECDYAILALGNGTYDLLPAQYSVKNTLAYASIMKVEVTGPLTNEVVIHLPEKIMVIPYPGYALLAYAGPLGVSDHPLTQTEEKQLINQCTNALERALQLRIDSVLDVQTGVYDNIQDGLPIVGELSKVKGLYVASGFNGIGFKFAPYIGEIVANEVLYSVVSPLLNGVRPERFITLQY